MFVWIPIGNKKIRFFSKKPNSFDIKINRNAISRCFFFLLSENTFVVFRFFLLFFVTNLTGGNTPYNRQLKIESQSQNSNQSTHLNGNEHFTLRTNLIRILSSFRTSRLFFRPFAFAWLNRQHEQIYIENIKQQMKFNWNDTLNATYVRENVSCNVLVCFVKPSASQCAFYDIITTERKILNTLNSIWELNTVSLCIHRATYIDWTAYVLGVLSDGRG